jgi:hypothetical protein
MAGGEDQNPASSSPEWTGEVVGSDEGLTTILFWGLDGEKAWSAGAGGGAVAELPPELVAPATTAVRRGGSDGSASGTAQGGARKGGTGLEGGGLKRKG